MKLKLLVILSRVPYPLDKGDKLRAFNQIKLLSEQYTILLFALNDGPVHPKSLDALKPFCQAIYFVELNKATIFFNTLNAFFTGIPLQVGYFYNSTLQKLLNRFLTKHKPDLIYCQLIRTAEYVKKIKNTPKALDYMDVFSKGVQRWANKSSFPLKMILNMEYKRLLKYENTVFNDFELKTIISEQDKALIFHEDNKTIKVIKNGVDLEYFHPINRTARYDLLFSGNMNYEPNIDSAVYLVNEILPLVRKHPKYKNITLLIAGATPHKKVLALKSAFVTVTGWVDDIRECFAESNIFIAPMQLSIGLQNKLLEALAMKKPCITSHLANNAIHAPVNECILVATTPEEYAQHILYLLDHKEEASRMAENGYQFVTKNYNWKLITNTLGQDLMNMYTSYIHK
jgi:sugar transferase (PEP-CTERM/EpsH1 system associated)